MNDVDRVRHRWQATFPCRDERTTSKGQPARTVGSGNQCLRSRTVERAIGAHGAPSARRSKRTGEFDGVPPRATGYRSKSLLDD